MDAARQELSTIDQSIDRLPQEIAAREAELATRASNIRFPDLTNKRRSLESAPKRRADAVARLVKLTGEDPARYASTVVIEQPPTKRKPEQPKVASRTPRGLLQPDNDRGTAEVS